jgi:putative NADH-flavin reductase
MKLVIFGATGRTGIALVQRALAAGHEVVALVRDPAKMIVQDNRLTLIQGDVMNRADVERAMSGDVGAVISVIGPTKNSPANMMPTAVDHIMAAMARHQISRLILMTGAGVAMPEDKPKLIDHAIKLALVIFAGSAYKQSEAAARRVQKSPLAWTIVRVPMLTDEPYSGNLRAGWVGVDTGPRLSRADAADFMLKQLSSDAYLRKAPVISN